MTGTPTTSGEQRPVSSILASATAHNKFPPDCGFKGHEPHISRRLAEERAKEQSPLNPTTGQRFKTCELHVGSMRNPASSNLGSFGVGILLYFQSLRCFSLLFFALALLSVPSMVIFYEGGFYNNEAAGLGGLATVLSMGNLGDAQVIGGEFADGETVRISCGDGTISAITGIYGAPDGVFGCPVAQQPSITSGECPNVGDSAANRCDGFCFEGKDPTANSPCCAPALKSSGIPDFSALELKPNPECNSASAPVIMRGLCLGRRSCNLTLSQGEVFSWKIRSSSTGCSSKNTTVGGSCVGETLEAACAAGTSRRLVVVAKCLKAEVSVSMLDTTYEKQGAVFGLTLIELASVFLAMVALSWAARRVDSLEEVLDGQVTTAADYAVFLPAIPRHNSVAELREALVTHFEAVVNDHKLSLPTFGWSERTDLRVADVSFAFASMPALLRGMTARGRALRKLEAVQANLVRLRRTFNPENAEEAQALMRCVHERTKHISKLEELDERIDTLCGDNQGKLRALSAFVTFEHEEGAARALQLYRGSTSAFTRLFQSRSKKLHRKHALSVTAAPEASDVLWANAGTPASDRRRRQGITALLTFVFLVVSALFALLVKCVSTAPTPFVHCYQAPGR